MEDGKTAGGVGLDRRALDRVEKRFWRDILESAPAEVAGERGIEVRNFGPVQASVVSALAGVGMMNLVLGATEPGAVADGHLAAAEEWAGSRGVRSYVPVTPGLPESESAERWLEANGFAASSAWMKFARDAHPPRFAAPADVEVLEVTRSGAGAVRDDRRHRLRPPRLGRGVLRRVAGAPRLALLRRPCRRRGPGLRGDAGPGRDRRVRDRRHAGARPRPRRQRALLRRRILDAADAGCRTLFVETGERVPDRPSASYRNILRAGFEEAYLRPNWTRST